MIGNIAIIANSVLPCLQFPTLFASSFVSLNVKLDVGGHKRKLHFKVVYFIVLVYF